MTNLTTIEHVIKHRCPACQKHTMYEMAYTEIDVDQRDSDGVPVTISYACCECERTLSKKQKWGPFTIRAEILDGA